MQWDHDGDDRRRATRPCCVRVAQLVWLEGSSVNNYSKQVRGFERILLGAVAQLGKDSFFHCGWQSLACCPENYPGCAGANAHQVRDGSGGGWFGCLAQQPADAFLD